MQHDSLLQAQNQGHTEEPATMILLNSLQAALLPSH